MSLKPLGAVTPVSLLTDAATAHYFARVEKRLETVGAAVADLNQTISGPSVAEVQAISDKVDELLAALRVGNAIDS